MLGITAQAICRWETGLAMPDIALLPSLANRFGVTTDELLGMDEIRLKFLSAAWETLFHPFAIRTFRIRADGMVSQADFLVRDMERDVE